MQSSRVEGFRLSPQQKHLWQLQPQAEPSPFYVQEAFLVEGELEPDILQLALQQVIDQHEILRTVFIHLPELDLPLQGVADEAFPLSFSYNDVDLPSLTPVDQETYITAALQAWREEALGSEEQASLFKVSLVKLAAPQQYYLLFSLPALFTDAKGLRNLIQEIMQLYMVNVHQAQSLSGPALQYIDVSEWQNEILESPETKSGHAYWQKQNLSSAVLSRLPLENTFELKEHFWPQEISHLLNGETLKKIDHLLQENNTSLSTFLLVCWQILLWRLTGEDKLVVGVGNDGRKYEELTHVVGLLNKYLPVSCQFSGDLTFDWVLTAVAYAAQEVQEWEESFIWEHVADQNHGEEPFFPFCFNYVELPYSFSLNGLSFTRLSQYQCTDQFKVKLTCIPRGNTISLAFYYDAMLFSPKEIELLKEQFLTLLQSILEDTNTPISQLAILSVDERQKLIDDFNPTKSQVPAKDCLPHLFAEQAKHQPERIALVCGDHQLTYGQLNNRANQLAHKLQGMDVGPEKVVALCVERSIEAIIGILGILKAGGAYLPIDHKLPPPRIAFMIEDAQADVIVTQEKWLDILPDAAVNTAICLDRDWHKIADCSTIDPVTQVTSNNLAYIIFTSGSTGKPKGVLIEHQSPIVLLEALENVVYKNSKGPLRASLNAPLFFDASVQQLVLLARGHSLVMVSEETRVDGKLFLEWKETNSLDVIDCTPSQLRLLVAGNLDETSQAVFLVAGEAIDQSLWDTLLEIPELTFFNVYGPTESTVDASACPISPLYPTPSIGHILPGYEGYILDRHLRLVPIGVPGELYIGGLAVARHYLNHPRLTADKFIPSPFGSGRLYKTGDIVRYTLDGRLEYLERIDNQVKLRGFRIELGEIEVALKNHEAIQEAFVNLHQSSLTKKQLVAYLLPKEKGQVPSFSELMLYLKQQLPDYMVPTNFITLASIPLTPNGKLDRRALPPPSQERPDLGEPFVAPRTEAEKVLADVWSKVLDAEKVGIDDNYFSLGGDSIRSIQIQAVVKDKGWNFALHDLFKYQTIRTLSDKLTLHTNKPMSTIQPFSLISEKDRQALPDGIEDAYPLSTLQLGMVFHSELTPELPIYQDVFTVQLRIPFDQQALEKALSKLVRHHPVLRVSFDIIHYEEPLQLIHKTAQVPLKITDISHRTQHEQYQMTSEIIEEEKSNSFDWNDPPFFRLHVCKHSEETFTFIVVEHQTILDGWSMAVLMSELFKQYLFYLGRSEESIEPAPTAMLRDAIALEREMINSQAAQTFWKDLLEGSLFTQMPRRQTGNQENSYNVHRVPIPPELSQQLGKLARALSVPIKTILLTAHIRIMSLLSGQSDIVTGYVTNTRPEIPDGERVIGLFLNTVPFRMRLGNCSWSELIQRTFQTELAILPYRYYPMGRLHNERGGSPLFETVFNFTHFHVYDTLPNIEGVEVLAQQFFEQTNLPMMVDFGLTSGGSQVTLTLSCTGFEEEQIRTFAGYYLETLEAMVHRPDESYPNALLLSRRETEQLLYSWNQTVKAFPTDRCYSQLFEQQASKTPDRIAVCYGELQVTYREINQRANQLALKLRRVGVSSGTIVALLANRSIDLLIGILAAFKTGGAYLPLDPRHPTQRQVQVLKQSQVTLVLAADDFILPLKESLVDQAQSVQILPLELPFDPGLGYKNFSAPMWPSNTAYVIYTSGSTGIPKGAVLEQRGMINHIFAKIHDLQLTEMDRVGQTASQCFDISVWQYLALLLVGGEVCILEDEIVLDPKSLLKAVIKQELTILETVPSLMRVLLEEVKREDTQTLSSLKLRWFIPTGEALTPDLCQDWFYHFKSIPLLNAYGPTECSDDVSHFQIMQKPVESTTNIPIGRPVANTQLYILDPQLNPVPTGVIGELYVGGIGVGRGYLNDPQQTARIFIPDLFGHNPGMRLYKTGDIVCYLPDGNIQFWGRVDHQVKVRGHRIELEEIRINLNRHAEVSDSVVTVYSESETIGDARLVAYIVPAQPDVCPTVEQLRSFLAEKLPDYMIPSLFIPLDALPLTANGKIDRKALPEPGYERSMLEKTVDAPTSPTEELLVQIFQKIIRVEEVGIYDSFFDLGGHSLLATQLIAQIRDVFQVELPLRELFLSPTVAELALSIEEFIIAELENLES